MKGRREGGKEREGGKIYILHLPQREINGKEKKENKLEEEEE